MPQPLIDALLDLIRELVAREPGSNAFYVVLGVSLLAALAVGRLFAGLFGSDQGIVAVLFALAIPFSLGLVTLGLIEVYLVPRFEAEWAALWLPWAGFALVVPCGTLAVSRNLLGLGGGLTLAIVLFAAAAGLGGWYAAGFTVDLIHHGEEKAAERNERLEGSLESVD